MIDVEVLKGVRTIVTHAGCADGVASALILKDALPDAEVFFVQYDTPDWRGLSARARMRPTVLFCDMTPPAEDAHFFIEDGAVVLDHHRGARELVAQFGDRGVYADEEAEPGVSGALLAFNEVWIQLVNWNYDRACRIKEFATLAGIRDTWERSSSRWEEACAQAAALRFWPWEDLEGLSLTGETFASRLDIGPVLLRKEAAEVEKAIQEAYYFKVRDLSCAAFEGLHTSDVADQLAAVDVDLVLGWHYAHRGGPKLAVSVRSRGELSALRLARRHGGGGHERAAGFTLDLVTRESEEPYVLLRNLVEEAMGK